MQCKVSSCDRTDKKGRFYKPYSLCGKHYQRMMKHGDSEKSSRYDKREAIIKNDYAKIPLGVGAKQGFTIINKEFSYLDSHKWYTHIGYAVSKINGKIVYLHHLIIGHPGKVKVIDHISRDKLDNRKSNLRIVSRSLNCFNAKLPNNNTSGFKGVCWHKAGKKWRVRVSDKYIGVFKDLSKAVFARKQAEIEMGVKYA